MTSKVARVLQHDRWAVAEGSKNIGPFVLRFRTPIVRADEVGQYVQLVQVLWAYAEEASGEMPSSQVSDEMGVFESRLCAAWENDGTAFLAAVLTFDGARQWVFYTRDVHACERRLNEMPQEYDPYPIEVTSRSDPSWNFLREDVLKQVNWQADQAEWERALAR